MCNAGVARAAAGPTDKLISVLIQIESSGNDLAIGDTNLTDKAYGPLQVRRDVCIDVNRRYGTHYTPQECLGNRELSIRIFRCYIQLYATKERLGHEPTDADYGRIWNGGPNGHRKKSTERYLLKMARAEKVLATRQSLVKK